MGRSAGFTLLEVLVALVVFAVGVLGLAAEAASLTGALARARRAAAVTNAATTRFERLRAGACVVRADGSDVVTQGSTQLARLEWAWSEGRDSTYRLRLLVTPAAAPIRPFGPETLSTVVLCR